MRCVKDAQLIQHIVYSVIQIHLTPIWKTIHARAHAHQLITIHLMVNV